MDQGHIERIGTLRDKIVALDGIHFYLSVFRNGDDVVASATCYESKPGTPKGKFKPMVTTKDLDDQ